MPIDYDLGAPTAKELELREEDLIDVAGKPPTAPRFRDMRKETYPLWKRAWLSVRRALIRAKGGDDG